MASNYDCSSCYCPGDFSYAYFDDYIYTDMSPTIDPTEASIYVGDRHGFSLTANFQDCNGYYYNHDVTEDQSSDYDHTDWCVDDENVASVHYPEGLRPSEQVRLPSPARTQGAWIGGTTAWSVNAIAQPAMAPLPHSMC